MLPTAIEVFVAGFAETKSRTWPYEIVRHESVWQLRDRERKNAHDYRKEEWVTLNAAPSTLHRIARRCSRDRYFLCPIMAMQGNAEELKADYKSLGYRLLASEPLFIHSLKRIPRSSSTAAISLLRTENQAIEFARATRIRPMQLQEITRDSYRQYLAYVDDTLVGWVRSVETPYGHWCSNLFVEKSFRRQGIATSLLEQMLRDDRQRGAQTSVLLSSHTGAHLYPIVGYRQHATLFIFAPIKQEAT